MEIALKVIYVQIRDLLFGRLLFVAQAPNVFFRHISIYVATSKTLYHVVVAADMKITF